MTDQSFAGGADTAVGPEPGYYPDPSIPGFVRYWGGSAWVPGTSRPAPAEGEVLEPPRFAARRPGAGAGALAGVRPVPPPAPAREPEPAASDGGGGAGERASGDTGPVYLDQTEGGASFVVGPRMEPVVEPAVEPVVQPVGGPVFRTGGEEAGGPGASGVSGEPSMAVDASGWQVDPRAQRGLMETGGAPRWVSWGVLPEAPGEEEGRAGEGRTPVDEAAAVDADPVAVGAAGGPAAVLVAGVPAAPAATTSTTAPASPAFPGSSASSDSLASSASSASPVSSVAVRAPERATVAEPVLAVSAPASEEPGKAAEAGAAQAPAPAPTPAAHPQRQAAKRRRPAPAPPAGLGRRLAARAVDTAVLAVVATAAGIPLGNSVSDHIQQKLDQARMASALSRHEVQVWLVDDVVVGKIAVLLGILLFVSLLYEVLPTARTGQTFGKRLTGIRVADAAASPSAAVRTRLSLGRSLLRWAVRQLSLFVPVALLWPLLDRSARRGWHDRAARTRVVRD
ncbi:RDD family protein [Kitasatospora sp. NPDC059722]|uniref:RDD family protein n=1 Tax=Kitasatospora sp. NPDC059722 TaxID=3346925 RepID=UPI0036BE6547